MKIGEEVMRKQRLDVKMRKKEETSPSQEEDCLTLLSGMSLYQGQTWLRRKRLPGHIL